MLLLDVRDPGGIDIHALSDQNKPRKLPLYGHDYTDHAQALGGT